MQIDFKEQVVLVTGATRGIGRQIAEDFAALGAQVIGTGTNQKDFERLSREGIEYLLGDFKSQNGINAFIQQLEAYPKIDVLINNAGMNRKGSIEETTDEDVNEIYSVNLKAPHRILKVVIPKMKHNRFGRIVNVSSILGMISKPNRTLYSSSKFGINGITKSLSIELGPDNILINSIAPGFIATDMTQMMLSDAEREALNKQIPLGRFGTPSEISKVVLFLSSPLNTYLTGQSIVVDGGFVNI